MDSHFNKLNPAQHELLTKVLEESCEVTHAISKIFLHGLDSTEPGCALTNQERLQNEIGDLLFFLNTAMDHGLISKKEIEKACLRRSKRTNHYLHHVELD